MLTTASNGAWTKALSLLVGAGGCFCLYLGAGMLLLSPSPPSEPYLDKGRMVYGVIPTASSAGLLIVAGWLWGRSCQSPDSGKYVLRAFLVSIAAIAISLEGLYIFARLKGWTP